MALACDLGLDSLQCCTEVHKWVWFRRYCTAARVAAAMVQRMTFPPVFLEEVRKKIKDISGDGEEFTHTHEKHTAFIQDMDEQLLLWLNR